MDIKDDDSEVTEGEDDHESEQEREDSDAAIAREVTEESTEEFALTAGQLALGKAAISKVRLFVAPLPCVC